MELTAEITQAVLGPLTETNTWYGIFLALAFRKHIRRLIEGSIGKVNEKMNGEVDDGDS